MFRFDGANIQQFPDIPAVSAEILALRGWEEEKRRAASAPWLSGPPSLGLVQPDLKSDCCEYQDFLRPYGSKRPEVERQSAKSHFKCLYSLRPDCKSDRAGCKSDRADTPSRKKKQASLFGSSLDFS